MTESQALLADYVRNGSESAFRELLTRYLDLVYSTAVRLVDGDTHRAKDVAQIVFSDLARMAGKLSGNSMLGGWLHHHTCFVARTVMRGERRRQVRERKAVEMNSLNAAAEDVFAQIAPALDEAIHELGPDDRNAILLRFYERRNLRSVGEALGISENVAQKRVARAVEELGALLKQRGVTLSATALAGGLTVGAVTAAPAGLAVTIAGTILTGAGVTGGLAVTSAKAAAATKLKVGIVVALLIAWVGSVVFLQTQSGGRSPQGAPAPPPQLEPLRAESMNRSEPATRNFARPPRQDQFGDLRKPEVETPPSTQSNPPPVLLATNPDRRPRANLPPQVLFAKATRLDARSGSKVRIEGTSTLHDWLVECPLITGFLEVGPNFPLEPDQLANPGEVQAHGEATIMVRQLRSVEKDGKYYSDAMDNKMREMMKMDQYPKIIYHLTELVLKEVSKTNAGPYAYIFDSKGELTVAGKTNKISMVVKLVPLGKRNGDQRVMITGSTPLKMTDYDISPNSIVISKIGDDVEIIFDWVLAAGHMVPLDLKLPQSAFKGTPKDQQFGPIVEPFSDKPRPAMMVPAGVKNVAAGKKVTSSDKNPPADVLAKITDGDKEATDQSIIFLRKGTQWVQIDLGKSHEIFAIAIWHAHNSAKVYHDVIVQVADDPDFIKNVGTLFNNDQDNSSGLGVGTDREFFETFEGKLINDTGVKARYVRTYSKGSSESALNEYTEVEVYGRLAP